MTLNRTFDVELQKRQDVACVKFLEIPKVSSRMIEILPNVFSYSSLLFRILYDEGARRVQKRELRSAESDKLISIVGMWKKPEEARLKRIQRATQHVEDMVRKANAGCWISAHLHRR